MHRLITVLLISILLAGCSNGKFVKINAPNTCGTTGWTVTTIHYGDSHIVVLPLSKVVKDAEFRFKLVPTGPHRDNYQGVTVKVRGKRAEDSWFEEAEGKANVDKGFIRVCVDGTSLDIGDDFFYIVEVEGVGILDPRARIITPPY
jgi:hypothetical protein